MPEKESPSQGRAGEGERTQRGAQRSSIRGSVEGRLIKRSVSFQEFSGSTQGKHNKLKKE